MPRGSYFYIRYLFKPHNEVCKLFFASTHKAYVSAGVVYRNYIAKDKFEAGVLYAHILFMCDRIVYLFDFYRKIKNSGITVHVQVCKLTLSVD